MWEKVSSRAHAPLKIFPFGPDANEVMLYGTVKYGLKAGGESSKDWAARAHLVKDGEGTVMMDFYQVYLVRHTASAGIVLGGLELITACRIRQTRAGSLFVLGKTLRSTLGAIDVGSNAPYGTRKHLVSIPL